MIGKVLELEFEFLNWITEYSKAVKDAIYQRIFEKCFYVHRYYFEKDEEKSRKQQRERKSVPT